MMRILLIALLLLPVSSFAGQQPVVGMMGMWGGQSSSSCSTGNLLSETYDPAGSDATWTQGYISAGCSADLDATTPTATGFSGQSYRVQLDADAYGESWRYWVDSSARSTVYGRFYLYVNTEGFDDGEGHRIFAYGANATYPNYLMFTVSQTAGTVSLTVLGLGGLSTDEVTITTGTSYLVEFYAVNNGSADSFEWKIDSTSQGTQSGALFDGDFQRINAGVHPDTSMTATIDFYIDKFDISSSGWLGACP